MNATCFTDICEMKHIVLFGAGKSATVLIDYLLVNAGKENWKVTVVDADLKLAQLKVGGNENAEAVSFDIKKDTERNRHIRHADIVISLLPPSLHIEVAKDCLKFHPVPLNALRKNFPPPKPHGRPPPSAWSRSRTRRHLNSTPARPTER